MHEHGPWVLGIDVGTTGIRAAVVHRDSGLVDEAHRETPPVFRPDGSAETDPAQWDRAVTSALLELHDRGTLARVRAVCAVGQAPSLVVVRCDGSSIGPAMLWLDSRARVEGLEQEARFGERPDVDNTIHSYYLGPKLSYWLRSHEECVRDVGSILMPHAYVATRLGALPYSDPSTASLYAPLFRRTTRAFDESIVAELGMDLRWFPDVRESTDVVGTVSREASMRTMLPEGIPIVAGGGDFAAATLASGVLAEGQGCLMLGTSGNLLSPTERPIPSKRLINSCHVGVPRYLSLGGTYCGAAIEWFRRAVAPATPFADLEAEGMEADSGAPLLFLPYLQGDRTPHWNDDLRGAWIGLSLSHGRGHLYRALLEGIAHGLLEALLLLRASGVVLDQVHAANGAGKSRLFRQILADALGVPVHYAPSAPGTVAGAGLLALLGAGLITSPDHGTRWLGAISTTLPRADAHERHMRQLEIRQRIVSSSMDGLTALVRSS